MPGNTTASLIPPTTPRTLRCANAGLYACGALLILISSIWYIIQHPGIEHYPLPIIGTILSLLWAAYYCTLRITIDSTGIKRSTLYSQRTLTWQAITHWEIQEQEEQEQATCRILLYSADTPTPLTISSELLPLDDVRQLAHQLQGHPPTTGSTP